MFLKKRLNKTSHETGDETSNKTSEESFDETGPPEEKIIPEVEKTTSKAEDEFNRVKEKFNFICKEIDTKQNQVCAYLYILHVVTHIRIEVLRNLFNLWEKC